MLRPLAKLSALLLVLVLTSVICLGQAQESKGSAEEILTNVTIVALSEPGLSPAIIVSKIQTSKTNFNVSTAELLRLKQEKVSDDVINAMIRESERTKQAANAPAKSEPNDRSSPHDPRNHLSETDSNREGKVNEPEFVGVVFRLGPGGELQPLERKSAIGRTKAKFMGYGGATTTLELEGEHCKGRVKSGEPIEFVVRSYAPQMDPSGIVQLYAFETKNNKRAVKVAGVGSLWFNSVKMDPNSGTLPLNVSRYGKASVKVVPALPLPAGEYAFRSASMDMFCFGVDPPKPK